MKIIKLQEQFIVIKVKVEKEELVLIVINGHSLYFKPFVWGLCACVELLARLDIVSTSLEEIQNLALLEKTRRGSI